MVHKFRMAFGESEQTYRGDDISEGEIMHKASYNGMPVAHKSGAY